jgi:hypothetical protein
MLIVVMVIDQVMRKVHIEFDISISVVIICLHVDSHILIHIKV